ncbi:hypothetical protein QV06_00980 [Gallibacterium genomosp. 3]|uniref:Terminase large subunit GpA endonuclease domain-containing protein n=1 Tax=Gallibacterium genomosp. 3 TaxID=505345 RepID=A0A1A7PVP5_9PAST|nr:hypothetical protein QV06_00980 [Gallibacterium genomosp. 3]
MVYEERGSDGKWRKPGKGNNEAFDLFCYAHAIAILRGYERIKWGDEKQVPDWAKLPEINPNILKNSTTDHTEASVVEKKQELPLKVNAMKENASWLTGKSYRKGGWL